ncbi:HD domain-containing phosphohydrolase [Heliophilum fasciatum]|nr:HD domain-containing phosphohydrolase [Heliophilum fasciatum]MCW2278228.1 HD-GYP domain-containing protein (c-di-GMP phosphodiesterase class II) [Heliophilum fasciatum]
MMKMNLPHLLTTFSTALDLGIHDLRNHHKRVAYIAVCMGEAMKLPPQDLLDLYCSASMHDIGAVTFDEKKSLLTFQAPNDHAVRGYHLLKNVPHFERMAEIILYHHEYWDKDKEKNPQKLLSNIVQIADRIVVLLNDEYVLHQRGAILDKVDKDFGTMICSDLQGVVSEIGKKQSFWLDLMSPFIDELAQDKLDRKSFEVNFTFDELRSLFQVYTKIIDMKNKFTYRHSMLVTNSAVQLGMLAGFSTEQLRRLELAGLVHDLGKLSIPESILEKNGPLTNEEMQLMHQHVYHTYHIIRRLPEFANIARWAAFHHERLDGRGYPFHIAGADLDVGCRIMAVADIFSALIEDRPYRAGLTKDKIEAILVKMVKDNAIDGDIVHLLLENYERFERVKEVTTEALHRARL